jgi:hypothetical protein
MAHDITAAARVAGRSGRITDQSKMVVEAHSLATFQSTIAKQEIAFRTHVRNTQKQPQKFKPRLERN